MDKKDDIIKLIAYIDTNYQEHINIDTLAKQLNMSKFHCIRIFKKYVGVTPIQFKHFIMLNFAKAKLKNSHNLLDTAYEMGLSSPSRLHDNFVNILSVTPNEFKNYGNEIDIIYGISNTILGKAILASTHSGICLFSFIKSDKNGIEYLTRFYKNANLCRDDDLIKDRFADFFGFESYNDTSNKLDSINKQYMLWNAFLSLASKIIKNGKSDDRLEFILDSIPCCLDIIKTNAFSNYRWGIMPKKIVVLYESIDFKGNNE